VGSQLSLVKQGYASICLGRRGLDGSWISGFELVDVVVIVFNARQA